MAHHGFGEYSASGSEHAIFLSGLDYFPLTWLKGNFDYVALGHIHKKQLLLSDPITLYPGSPIPLRFSESNKKYISQININQEGLNQIDIQVPVFKKLVQVKTNIDNYIKDIKQLIDEVANDNSPVFLEVLIQLSEAKSGIVDHIRELIHEENIELISYIPNIDSSNNSGLDYTQVKNLNLNELFEKYYKHKFDTEQIPKKVLNNFQHLLEEINNENSQA